MTVNSSYVLRVQVVGQALFAKGNGAQDFVSVELDDGDGIERLIAGVDTISERDSLCAGENRCFVSGLEPAWQRTG